MTFAHHRPDISDPLLGMVRAGFMRLGAFQQAPMEPRASPETITSASPKPARSTTPTSLIAILCRAPACRPKFDRVLASERRLVSYQEGSDEQGCRVRRRA